jgi:hypothetical protein
MGSDFEWPEWWYWELDFELSHLRDRMRDRDLTELDLREMLEIANNYRPDVEAGRWVIRTERKDMVWYIIMEPQMDEKILKVITAFSPSK